jgi:F0F1-type ATP synthase membrane subunit b/b'
MGKQARIKKLQRQLRTELNKINKDLSPQENETLFKTARKRMLKEFLSPNQQKALKD